MNVSLSIASGLAARRLVPELLDGLPVEDPRARRSRADLCRINVMMRHAAIVDALVETHLDASDRPPRLLELGAGDGRASLRLARRIARRRGPGTITMLDMAPSVSDETLEGFAALGWDARVVAEDAFDWLRRETGSFDLALANLFLHHFAEPDLARLLSAVARRADLLVATEPLRTLPSLVASRLVGLIGANDVTRHDAPASVRAGFRGVEIGAVWAQGCGSVLEEAAYLPFTHAFVGRAHPSARIGTSG